MAAVGAGIALGVAARLAVGNPREFVAKQRSKWCPENRPCGHPMNCDMRDALGLMHGVAYTTKDVKKHAKQASRWWHADSNSGVDHGFADFRRISAILEVPRLRSAYASDVEKERRLARDLGQEVQWRSFNERFARSVECERGTWTPRATPTTTAEVEICHVFLDASCSMNTPSCIGHGKKLFRDVSPRFIATPTNVHLIGADRGPDRSRCIVPHLDVINASDVEMVLEKWEPSAWGTFLWHYIFEEVNKYKDAKHEVLVITDGVDNCSPGAFRGLTGFDELMKRLSGAQLRVSLRLVGNSPPVSSTCAYRDVCLASGGFFAAGAAGDSDDLLDWVVPLLLPEGERDLMAMDQQAAYEQLLLRGEAQQFSWYVPIAGEEQGSAVTTSAPALSPSVRVALRGLQAAPDLNGEVGTVEKWLEESGRWQVKFDRDQQARSIKPANLTVLPSVPPE